MDSLEELKEKINQFVKDRDWDQFHSPANIAKSISIESGELLECFQWDEEHFDKEAVCEELADVLNYCVQMGIALDVDLKDIVLKKMEKNAKKYPVEKCKGNATKYDKLK
ncbi:MAG: nucleotide pyrophosphohydrolase [Bacilli bacterium]|jgi:NTP pyrophosphatase (non-canonical NTP hydrolase)|nr:nucleotide pyrophosphohydrolase [Bacilli bacterium]MCH4210651.1 nucleotide pyrophosphohydrolase [Bacilli bacterium]MCH4229110.1 nucleotide pyrophosphohydrolase [Bacilli bacterium]MCH4278218.1 nucleotide pyrophosphohydrolase [Bacilli bacterium]MCI2055143.1 nucleotide pyrophosphohydrolase [Bacilli bacterium]